MLYPPLTMLHPLIVLQPLTRRFLRSSAARRCSPSPPCYRTASSPPPPRRPCPSATPPCSACSASTALSSPPSVAGMPPPCALPRGARGWARRWSLQGCSWRLLPRPSSRCTRGRRQQVRRPDGLRCASRHPLLRTTALRSSRRPCSRRRCYTPHGTPSYTPSLERAQPLACYVCHATTTRAMLRPHALARYTPPLSATLALTLTLTLTLTRTLTHPSARPSPLAGVGPRGQARARLPRRRRRRRPVRG